MSVTVLYRIVNNQSDSDEFSFNAFSMPRGPKGPTLASVKQNCHALRELSHLGPDGYHWRVCVEEKGAPSEDGSRGAFTWWDIQDEAAVLPIKEASPSQLSKFFAPPEKADHSDGATKAARGAAKTMFRAVAGAVSGGGEEQGPPVPVIAFKLLDLVKMDDDFKLKNPGLVGQGGGGMSEQAGGRRGSFFRSSVAHIPATPVQPPPPQRQAPVVTQSAPSYQPPPRAPPAAAPRPQAPAPVQGNLMDFTPPTNPKNLAHTTSSPAAFNAAGRPNENRAQKLQREYSKKQSSQNLEWDPIEERMVEKGSMANGSASGSADMDTPKANIVGTKLDASSAVGKSAEVASAVHGRINAMKESQDKALREMRERTAAQEKDKADEDEVRKRLEPKIKSWSEEHGKKKQLRALLGTLHTILWPDSGWKQVTIGDILDDGKVKKVYFKASRIVHPDKAAGLDAEKRFLAKRIFDSLTQAKVEFDAGK